MCHNCANHEHGAACLGCGCRCRIILDPFGHDDPTVIGWDVGDPDGDPTAPTIGEGWVA